ncbi:MAG TPA: LuxR C-terminal-related transcriptional regulator [Streptosporangiaceae bacterium]|jgi:DNA-binding CsgD family transcriptional regulator/tetratricopeptide (TPR) repeat protein
MVIRDDWPLAGRRQQLAEIETACRTGNAGVVIIAGPTGVGKTRLATEVLVRADARGDLTHWAAATQTARGIPFGALAHLFPNGEEGVFRTVLTSLQAAGQVLRRQANGKPLIMGVDDIHLLDNASAALIHHLIVSGDAFVIATARSAEPVPDVFTSLWRQGAARWLELGPLTEDATGELLNSLLGDQVDGKVSHRSYLLSQGNPLYLRELVQAATATSALRKVEGVWRLSGGLSPTAPLEQLVQAHLNRVDPGARRAVQVVALCEPLGFGLLQQMYPEPALEKAEAAGLIEVRPDGNRRNVWLAQPLIGEVIRATLPPLRRIALQRRVADVLAATGARRGEDLLRLALWRLESGARTSPALLLAATREAAGRGDHRLAARLARVARDAGAGFPATILAAESLAWQGRADLADRLFAQADREAADPRERAHVARSRATLLFLNFRRLTTAQRLIERAPRGDPADVGMRLVTRAFLDVQAGRTADALRVLRPLVAHPPTEQVRRHTLPTLANALAAAGRTEEALRVCRQATRTPPPDREHRGYLTESLDLATFNALLHHGSLRHAEALAATRYRRALDSDDDRARTAWAYALGRTALGRGKFGTAERWLRESLHLLREYPTLIGPVGLLTCLGVLAMIATLQGLPEAACLLAEAERTRQEDVFAPDYELAMAWIARLRGDTECARSSAWRTAERATALGDYVHATRAMHTLVRFGVAGQALEPLATLVDRLQGRARGLFASHAAAVDADDGAKLGQCAGIFAKLGMMRIAAEAAATAAAVHRRRTERRAAAAAMAIANRYARECDGAPVRALLPEDAVATLSVRERQIAMLAISGMINREIAERLVLSVRTVENHLYRVYAKLGINGREELTGFLWDAGA